MKCGLCGYEFSEQDADCNPACPFAGGCAVVCCPRCGYGAPDESRSMLLRLARKARDMVGGRSRRREADPMSDRKKALPLSSLRTGQEGHVAYVGTEDSRRLEQLSSLGIVPGVALRILQKRLAAVVRVGETEVALDFDIARQIYVWPVAPSG